MTTGTLPRREFLQLAETYKPEKDKIAGFYISEKLDGGRAFRDGGLTRGCPLEEVPWANITDPKTGKRKVKLKEATGLYSRYGNPIAAPSWFLNQLPCCPLDGELFAGRGKFQTCMSVIRKDVPIDSEWRQIQFAVYSSPPATQIFRDGEIKNSNFHSTFVAEKILAYVEGRLDDFGGDYRCVDPDATFERELAFLRDAIETQNDHVYLHRQVKLPMDEEAARRAAESFLSGVLDKGGEGAIIRSGTATWVPKRHKGLLKYKPFEDAEAFIVGFVAGREGKQGNVLGKIGALICRTQGPKGIVEFELGTGLTLEERYLDQGKDFEWAYKHPGQKMPLNTKPRHFRIGQTVTFKFREWTDDGYPKEGRLWRLREGIE